MTVKALFLDLDGTSLNDNNALSPALQKILTILKTKGIHIIFSTGRSFAGALPFANAIGGTDYAINYNGARVFDFKNERILHAATLPKQVLKRVFDFSQQYQYPPIFYHDNVIYTKDGIPHHYTCPGERFEVLHPHHDWINETLTKALFVLPEDELRMHLDIAYDYFSEASVSTSSSTYLEVMPKGINKSIGVSHVLEALNLDPKYCAAFGDQLNDLEMLSLVEHPFVMGNATPQLKAQFPDRVIETNMHDGVAKKLDHIFELNYFK